MCYAYTLFRDQAECSRLISHCRVEHSSCDILVDRRSVSLGFSSRSRVLQNERETLTVLSNESFRGMLFYKVIAFEPKII